MTVNHVKNKVEKKARFSKIKINILYPQKFSYVERKYKICIFCNKTHGNVNSFGTAKHNVREVWVSVAQGYFTETAPHMIDR